jgi:hypothetical protein
MLEFVILRVRTESDRRYAEDCCKSEKFFVRDGYLWVRVVDS